MIVKNLTVGRRQLTLKRGSVFRCDCSCVVLTPRLFRQAAEHFGLVVTKGYALGERYDLFTHKGCGVNFDAVREWFLADNTTLSSAGGASRKIPIAHHAHTGDSVFPYADVQRDWAKIRAAGFALDTEATAGDHDGDSNTWANWLMPRMADWRAP